MYLYIVSDNPFSTQPKYMLFIFQIFINIYDFAELLKKNIYSVEGNLIHYFRI